MKKYLVLAFVVLIGSGVFVSDKIKPWVNSLLHTMKMGAQGEINWKNRYTTQVNFKGALIGEKEDVQVKSKEVQFQYTIMPLLSKDNILKNGFPEVIFKKISSATKVSENILEVLFDDGVARRIALSDDLAKLDKDTLLDLMNQISGIDWKNKDFTFSDIDGGASVFQSQDIKSQVEQLISKNDLTVDVDELMRDMELLVQEVGLMVIDADLYVEEMSAYSTEFFNIMAQYCPTDDAYYYENEGINHTDTTYWDNGNVSTKEYRYDDNGVETVTDTIYYSSGETWTQTTDNDHDNNGFPDDNNDGGFDWPFSDDHIWDRTEGRFPMIYSSVFTQNLYAQKTFADLLDSFRSGNLEADAFVNQVSIYFAGISSDLTGFIDQQFKNTFQVEPPVLTVRTVTILQN